MRRQLWMVAMVFAGFTLSSCSKGGGKDRLVDGSSVNTAPRPSGPPADPGTNNPADPGVPGDPGTPAIATPVPPAPEPTPPSPAPEPTPPAPVESSTPTAPTPTLPRYETYRFEGFVIAGGTYPAGVTEADPVSGTFRIDFEQPRLATNGEYDIYHAFDAMSGTVGTFAFSTNQDDVYVGGNATIPYFVDTAFMTLNGSEINFDLFFFLADGEPMLTGNGLAGMRDMDKRAYRRMVLWFETDPRNGTGFNADLFSVQRVDPPTMAGR